jgi:hypothetical protein|tara:strand:- start:16 stop:144 length:129 start_codon:yes stop_codon:yes gene_type:complete
VAKVVVARDGNEKTISIRVSGLRNYCPIFYGSGWNWVRTEDM